MSENSTEFACVVTILEGCEAELTAMRKSSREACFTTNRSNTDKDFQLCRNFFRRKKNMLTQEQEKMLAAWTEKMCGDGAEVRPAIDAEFTRVVTILEHREAELTAIKPCSLFHDKPQQHRSGFDVTISFNARRIC